MNQWEEDVQIRVTKECSEERYEEKMYDSLDRCEGSKDGLCKVKKRGVLVMCSMWMGSVILQWSTRKEKGVGFDEDEEGEEYMVGAVRREG